MEEMKGSWSQCIKVWGMERWLHNNEKYCMKELRLLKGFMCSIHYHRIKTETFYIVSGEIWMERETEGKGWEGIRMGPGDHIQIDPFRSHRFGGIKESVLIEASTQHFDNDSYRETESGRMANDGKGKDFTE